MIMIVLLSLMMAHSKEVMDLGELKIQGDVRKPSVDFYQLKTLHPDQIKELSELSFKEFEKELLKRNKHEL